MFKRILTPLIAISLIFIQGCSNDGDYAKRVVTEIKPKLALLSMNYSAIEKAAETTDYVKGKYKAGLGIALNKLQKENPSDEAIAGMITQFKYDTTKNGDVFKAFKTEYDNLLNKSINQKIISNTYKGKDLNLLKNFNIEIDQLNSSMTAQRFDENFVDYINIVASISKTIDPVIITKSDLSSKAAVGSQFIGNPQYGQWEQNSSGNMFWNFFAAYMFFDFIQDSRYGGYNRGYSSYGSYRYSGSYSSSSRYRYDSWNNNRNWSYYNDKKIKDYASPKEKAKYNKWANKGKSKYSSSFKKNTNLSKTTKKISTNTKFKSSFSSKASKGGSSGSKFNSGTKFKSSMKSPNIRGSSSSKSTKRGK